MQKLNNIIGQREAVSRINQIVTASKEAARRDERFYWPAIKFGGLSGLGKSYLAEALAEAVGRTMHEAPINAGWTWYKYVANQLTSINKETGETSPIPAVVYIDEAHSQKTLRDAFKKLIEKDKQIITRNGTTWDSDLSEHVWIMASNETLDKALERRCEINIELVPYSRAEKIKLLQMYLKRAASDETLAYLETRCKPTAADCKTIAVNANIYAGEELDMSAARKLVSQMGRFQEGLERGDIRAMERLKGGPANVHTLKHVMQFTGETGEKKVKDSMGMLCGMSYVEQLNASSFAITKPGIRYLDKLKAAIEAAKVAQG